MGQVGAKWPVKQEPDPSPILIELELGSIFTPMCYTLPTFLAQSLNGIGMALYMIKGLAF